MVRVRVMEARQQFRVTRDGANPIYKYSLEDAEEAAERIASFGSYCEVEEQRRPGALWSLLYTFRPVKGGRFIRHDPREES